MNHLKFAAWALSFLLLFIFESSNYSSSLLVAIASSLSYSKQKEVIEVFAAKTEDSSALHLITLVRTDQDLRAFRSMLGQVVPAGTTFKRCERVRISVSL